MLLYLKILAVLLTLRAVLDAAFATTRMPLWAYNTLFALGLTVTTYGTVRYLRRRSP